MKAADDRAVYPNTVVLAKVGIGNARNVLHSIALGVFLEYRPFHASLYSFRYAREFEFEIGGYLRGYEDGSVRKADEAKRSTHVDPSF